MTETKAEYVRIPLAVKIDGVTVHPPGWMFVWAAAVDGFAWAVEQCATPEFHAVVAAWHRDNPDGLVRAPSSADLQRKP